MLQILGDLNKIYHKMLEELIYWISVFEDKEIIELKIKEKYPTITTKQINQLLSKSYTGWGRLSSKLLGEMPIDKVKNLTFLVFMDIEPKVLMEILVEEKYVLKEGIVRKIQDVNKNGIKI